MSTTSFTIPGQDCLWILTGDYGDECRILSAACDFSRVEVILHGRQQARAVAAVPTQSRTCIFPQIRRSKPNFIYRLDRAGSLSQLAPSAVHRSTDAASAAKLFFPPWSSPAKSIAIANVRSLWGARVLADRWESLLSWKKDRWSMRFFQYGNAFLPDGKNATNVLAVTSIAVHNDDMVTSLFSVNS